MQLVSTCTKLVLHAGVLLTLVFLESAPGSSEDLATKCRRALKSVVAKLTSLPALDALVHQQLPESVMKMVLEQVGGLGDTLTPEAAVLAVVSSSEKTCQQLRLSFLKQHVSAVLSDCPHVSMMLNILTQWCVT